MKTKTIIRSLQIIAMLYIVVISFSCKKEETFVSPPEIKTLEGSDMTYNSSTLSGSIISDGSSSISERGICWATETMPDLEDNKMVYTDTLATDTFSLTISGLENNTTFYARAYAVNSVGISYGNEISFTLWLDSPGEPISDIDNNTYSTVKIGNQVWMQENLKVTHYQNGDAMEYLPMIKDSVWLHTESGAYCIFDDIPENAVKYGNLYNGNAVTDERNICPEGWHIPSKNEWYELFDYLGGISEANKLLRSGNDWTDLESGLTSNISGFSAKQTGIRWHPYPTRTYTLYYIDGTLGLTNCSFWMKNEDTDIDDWRWYVGMDKINLWVNQNSFKTMGMSIRCLKD